MPRIRNYVNAPKEMGLTEVLFLHLAHVSADGHAVVPAQRYPMVPS
jgi:hypothetical protein